MNVQDRAGEGHEAEAVPLDVSQRNGSTLEPDRVMCLSDGTGNASVRNHLLKADATSMRPEA